MKTIKIESLEQTNALAQKLASKIKAPFVLALKGDLGAGKTTFTKAFAKALGVKKVVNSPTFTIMKSYALPEGNSLYHIDAYRLEGMEQELGLEECFENGICVVEWPQFFPELQQQPYLEIDMEYGPEESRLFHVDTNSDELKELEEWL